MGSVKDLTILKEPADREFGVGRFLFSDRYSVFDWGEMPDHIKDKGSAICMATAHFFEEAERLGIKTHYRGVVEDGKAKRLSELKKPQNVLEFNLVMVVKPKLQDGKYDYSVYKNETGNFLIPLEVIYRNALPEGSSVFKRLRDGSLKLEDIGLKEQPKPGQILDKPILDVSTKLETTDRYVSWREAQEMCSLNDIELENIKNTILKIDELITSEAKKIGLFNEDGKVEFGFDADRNIVLVDALGTLDECRFTYNGVPVSKEIARIYYRKTDWFKDVEEAKKKNRLNWKDVIESFPKPLPKEFAESISNLYKAYVNEITKHKWYDVPSLKTVLENIKKFI
jgi:phosphoribosylaminoimidazole-succinocarboxamide synthase